MNIDVSVNALDGLHAVLKREVERKWEIVGKVAQEAAEFGSSTAQSYTRSRPGAKTGKAGRVYSGDMAADIRWKTLGFSNKSARAQYGFVNQFREYYRYQTVTGFRHVRSKNAQYIAPTFALRDSINPVRDFATTQLRARL